VNEVPTTRQLLVVCTANLCRSPVAEALLARRLTGLVDVDGATWTVASAGTDRYGGVVEPDTAAAAAAVGLDIAAHVPRQLVPLDLEQADLVLTMTRAHLRSVVVADPSVWPRTFTIREFARRSMTAPAATDGFAGWLRSLGAGRRAADLADSAPDDDVVDPYRQGRPANIAMVTQLTALVDDLIAFGPWLPAQPR
jgi:protein-tyrosine phosphatase